MLAGPRRLMLLLLVCTVALLPFREGRAVKCPPDWVPMRLELVKTGPVVDAEGAVLSGEDAKWPQEVTAFSRRGDDGRTLLDLETAYAGETVSAVSE